MAYSADHSHRIVFRLSVSIMLVRRSEIGGCRAAELDWVDATHKGVRLAQIRTSIVLGVVAGYAPGQTACHGGLEGNKVYISCHHLPATA